MKLTEKQELLFEFVKQKHGGQVRKYTGEPYWNHLLSVAEIVSEYEPLCVEIALCHDLFEDTDCHFDKLYVKMLKIGYEVDYAIDVCACVEELTDKFTSEVYPYLNRGIRKECEALRLGTVSYMAQTVKYADILDNTKSIFAHDQKFASVYFKEISANLELMKDGNAELYTIARRDITDRWVKMDKK